jgi:hypothetical protein
MPTISWFLGIAIQMYYEDHPPPHIHVKYNEYQARFAIETGELISGSLPARARRLVQEWIGLRRAELTANWRRMEAGEQMERIEGLE